MLWWWCKYVGQIPHLYDIIIIVHAYCIYTNIHSTMATIFEQFNSWDVAHSVIVFCSADGYSRAVRAMICVCV